MKRKYSMPMLTVFLASPSMVVGSGEMDQGSACSKGYVEMEMDDDEEGALY